LSSSENQYLVSLSSEDNKPIIPSVEINYLIIAALFYTPFIINNETANLVAQSCTNLVHALYSV